MPSVRMDQLLFFLKDLLNELLMVRAQLFNTASILALQLAFRLHAGV